MQENEDLKEEVQETILQENEKKPINRKKTILSILLILLITVVVFVVFFNFNDFQETISLMRKVDGIDMTLAFICLMLYAATWPLSLCLIAKHNRFQTKFIDNYLIGLSEHFFNGITPFSMGGQPIQVYLFTQKKVKASHSTGIIVANFIALMIATNTFAIAALVYYAKFSENFNSSTSWMIALGFAMNLFVLVFMILMATCKFVRDFFKTILEKLCNIKWIGKHLAKAIPAFDKYCENAQAAAKEIFANKLMFIGAVLFRMLSLVFYYAIPFYILRALGINLGFDLLPYIILASAFAITTMVWVPTPGGTGGIEFAFTTIFTTSMFVGVTQAIGATAMIIWRGLTYYLLMIISLIGYICFEIIVKKKKTKEVKLDDPCITNGE